MRKKQSNGRDFYLTDKIKTSLKHPLDNSTPTPMSSPVKSSNFLPPDEDSGIPRKRKRANVETISAQMNSFKFDECDMQPPNKYGAVTQDFEMSDESDGSETDEGKGAIRLWPELRDMIARSKDIFNPNILQPSTSKALVLYQPKEQILFGKSNDMSQGQKPEDQEVDQGFYEPQPEISFPDDSPTDQVSPVFGRRKRLFNNKRSTPVIVELDESGADDDNTVESMDAE